MAISLILFGPFYENKNDATITRQILTSTENIKSWNYGNDLLKVDIFFRDGLILLKACGFKQKYFEIHKCIKEKIITQFQAHMLTDYAQKGAWLLKATMAG